MEKDDCKYYDHDTCTLRGGVPACLGCGFYDGAAIGSKVGIKNEEENDGD